MRPLIITLSLLFLLLAAPGCGDDGSTGGKAGDTAGADTAGTDVAVETDDDATAPDVEDETDGGGEETLTPEQLYLISDDYAQEAGAALSAANTRFAVKLFKELNVGLGAGENIFVSPFSISTALAMVYNGASGETKQAMADTLEVAELDLAELNSAYFNLIKSLESVDVDVLLQIANSVWMEEGFAPSVQADFLELVAAAFGSEVFTEDFADPATLDKINGWIEDNTGGKIKDMLDQIPPDALMYLVNALYFKAAWTFPFDPEDTSEWDFTRSDGATKTVPMMTYGSLVTSFAYMADADYCAVRLPYGRDKVAFYGFIPWSYDSDKTVEDFIADLTPEKLEAYFQGVDYPQSDGEGITIAVPRFKIEYKETLNDVLEALGMGPAFGAGGFDGIAEGLGISRVIHQTFIEVNEEGTEAAAATVVEMFSGITPSFVGDKPFFFVIRDDRSGSILFMGKVADPTAG